MYIILVQSTCTVWNAHIVRNIYKTSFPIDKFFRKFCQNLKYLPYIWRNVKPKRTAFQKSRKDLSHNITKPTKWVCAQRRLRSAWASTQSDQSFRCQHEEKAWVFSYLISASEDSDQTGQMPRLIWVFPGRTVTLLVLSCRNWFI